ASLYLLVLSLNSLVAVHRSLAKAPGEVCALRNLNRVHYGVHAAPSGELSTSTCRVKSDNTIAIQARPAGQRKCVLKLGVVERQPSDGEPLIAARKVRGQCAAKPWESYREVVMRLDSPDAASITFISLNDLVNAADNPTKSETLVPEKQSR